MIALFIFMMVLQLSADTSSVDPSAYETLEYQIKDRNFKATFDPSSGDIILYHSNDRRIVSLSEDGSVDTLGTIPQNLDGLDKMDVTSDGRSIYFWENGIGRVHRYDIASDTIVREDTSHPHRTMFSHAPFLSRDNFIYAIGGYGYWEFRNFLIRYEPEFGQWEKLPSLNDDAVVRSWKGLLYKLDDTFYYLVDHPEDDGSVKTYVYRFEVDESTWYRESELESIFVKLKIMNRGVSGTFPQNTTYMIDNNNRHLAFLSSTTENSLLNFISLDESVVYQLNLNMLGINDVRAVFYSDRIDHWIILGHEFAWTERDNLEAYLFEFDKNNPFITVFEPESEQPIDQNLILTAGGLLVFVLIGILLYYRRQSGDSEPAVSAPSTPDASDPPVMIYTDEDDGITVFIHGKRFHTAEDQALRELWKIIAEMVESGDSSILVSRVDQRLYSDQSHASYNSRNRKKLINLINSTCGFKLLNEERSKVDKRYKVLTIQNSKIGISTS